MHEVNCLESEALVVLGRFVFQTGAHALGLTYEVSVLRALIFRSKFPLKMLYTMVTGNAEGRR